MKYNVSTLPRAEFDAQHIYDWIKERSPEGAIRWWESFEAAYTRLERNPLSFPLALEADRCQKEIRQVLFRTRRGSYYRALFMVTELDVQILRIRGPGEPDLQEDELL